MIQNLNAEIGGSALQGRPVAKPDKLIKIVHFLSEGIVSCADQKVRDNEFTRVKSTSALAAFILQKFISSRDFTGENFSPENQNLSQIVNSIVTGLNSEDERIRKKWDQKVATYRHFIIDTTEDHSSFFSLLDSRDLFTTDLSRLRPLIEDCLSLLRDVIEPEDEAPKKLAKKRPREDSSIPNGKQVSRKVDDFLKSLPG